MIEMRELILSQSQMDSILITDLVLINDVTMSFRCLDQLFGLSRTRSESERVPLVF